jgi:hypothetical protein
VHAAACTKPHGTYSESPGVKVTSASGAWPSGGRAVAQRAGIPAEHLPGLLAVELQDDDVVRVEMRDEALRRDRSEVGVDADWKRQLAGQSFGQLVQARGGAFQPIDDEGESLPDQLLDAFGVRAEQPAPGHRPRPVGGQFAPAHQPGVYARDRAHGQQRVSSAGPNRSAKRSCGPRFR